VHRQLAPPLLRRDGTSVSPKAQHPRFVCVDSGETRGLPPHVHVSPLHMRGFLLLRQLLRPHQGRPPGPALLREAQSVGAHRLFMLQRFQGIAHTRLLSLPHHPRPEPCAVRLCARRTPARTCAEEASSAGVTAGSKRRRDSTAADRDAEGSGGSAGNRSSARDSSFDDGGSSSRSSRAHYYCADDVEDEFGFSAVAASDGWLRIAGAAAPDSYINIRYTRSPSPGPMLTLSPPKPPLPLARG
jgi:hypothetical protein